MCSRQIIYKSFHTLIGKRTSPALISVPNLMLQVTRESSYRSSKPLGSPDLYTDVEISKSPEEWKFVERLLPLETVPEPTLKSDYPSGWRPSSASALNLPYYIERNRNHMHPVYLKIGNRGFKRTTQIKKIHGDIWTLQGELKSYLEKQNGRKHIYMQVHEVCRQINVKGDYVSVVQEWLQDKGF